MKWRERLGAKASVLSGRVSGSRVRLFQSPVGRHHFQLPGFRLWNSSTASCRAIDRYNDIVVCFASWGNGAETEWEYPKQPQASAPYPVCAVDYHHAIKNTWNKNWTCFSQGKSTIFLQGNVLRSQLPAVGNGMLLTPIPAWRN